MITKIRRRAFRAFGTLAPETAAGWFERVLLTPRPAPKQDTPVPIAPHHSARIPYGDGWVNVTHWGDGPTVLLLHGWGGTSTSLFAYVDPLVQEGFKAVAFDAPAHGQSAGVRTNLVEYAGAVMQVGNFFGPVVGTVAHSFGGPASALAAAHGMDPGRVVMLGAPLSIYEMSLEVADAIGLPRKVAELMATRLARRLQFEWQDMSTDKLVSKLAAQMLVVHDRGDRTVPFANGVAISEAAGGRLLETEDLGHRGILTDRSVISQVVDFVADSPSKRVTA